MEQLDRCNLCDGTRFSVFAEMTGSKTGKQFRVMTCDDCGLRFISPRLSAEENTALYDEAYYNGRGFDSSVNYIDAASEFIARQDENAGILQKIALFKPGTHVRVLDVGCGTGGLLAALGAAGYHDVWGVELSEYAAGIARERSGRHVLVGDIVGADLPVGTFDLINATEVIEHLRDPRAFFTRVHALLAPGGVFQYSTGNARGLYARLCGARWPYFHPEGHLFYFDPSTLARYFTAVGLEPLDTVALDRDERAELLRAEGNIACSRLKYLAKTTTGLGGALYRAAAAFDSPMSRQALARMLGKYKLPVAIKR